ncbi:uncharacterized protein LOC144102296 [Amblyomma americanum]
MIHSSGFERAPSSTTRKLHLRVSESIQSSVLNKRKRYLSIAAGRRNVILWRQAELGVPRIRKPLEGTKGSWTSVTIGSEIPGGFFSRSMQTEPRDNRSLAPCPFTQKTTTWAVARAGTQSPSVKSSCFYRLAVK